MLQVSRSGSLKIPKEIEIVEKKINSNKDILEVKKAYFTALNRKFNEEKEIKKLDNELDIIFKIPTNSNDLIVITVVKKLGAYITTVTQKSPKKFRSVFVNRMQNYCLDTLEYLLKANFIRLDSKENKQKREEYQNEAIIKLKLLGYISMVASISGCILKRQYKQISIQITEAINLVIAWKKSDDSRYNGRKGF